MIELELNLFLKYSDKKSDNRKVTNCDPSKPTFASFSQKIKTYEDKYIEFLFFNSIEKTVA